MTYACELVRFYFCALLVNEINFVVDFDHGVHQLVGHLQVPEDVQDVHFLIDCLWVTDVSHVDQQILTEGRTPCQKQHHEGVDLAKSPSATLTECLISSRVAEKESMSWCGS